MLYPEIKLLADKEELTSHPAKEEAVGVDVTEVTAVPPLATGRAVPEYPIANVPDDVIGLPEIDNTLGTDAATEVTVPAVAGAADVQFVPFEVKILPELPAVVGKVAVE